MITTCDLSFVFGLRRECNCGSTWISYKHTWCAIFQYVDTSGPTGKIGEEKKTSSASGLGLHDLELSLYSLTVRRLGNDKVWA